MKNLILMLIVVLGVACAAPEQGPAVVDWQVAELPAIDSVKGAPTLVDTKLGKAVRFNGESDGYFLGENPLKGMTELTIEVIFRQEADAAFEQRFLHMGRVNGPRILFETRVNPDSTWYLDTYIRLDKETDLVLIDPNQTHPTDRWYNLAMVVAEGKATSYVDGQMQLTGEIPYREIVEGITSVGVRQNQVCWFKGDLYRIRITPRALTPEEFLKDHEALNE
ncbi:MAG: LamG-like jellyroll fold domain-containing protein [Rikenellaceae bacterium]|nr:LamG-like jellyroll fold domain-containing protein [Rikenellaceae bacterium]